MGKYQEGLENRYAAAQEHSTRGDLDFFRQRIYLHWCKSSTFDGERRSCINKAELTHSPDTDKRILV